jgi:hypothetical protein
MRMYLYTVTEKRKLVDIYSSHRNYNFLYRRSFGKQKMYRISYEANVNFKFTSIFLVIIGS